LVIKGILRLGLSTKFPTFPFNVSIDRPVETTWVLGQKTGRGQVPFTKTTTTINWVSSFLVSILTGNDFTNKSRHPCLVTFSPPSMVRTGESDLVRLDHLTNTVRREKRKKARILPFS
jgi:hypothetical protein